MRMYPNESKGFQRHSTSKLTDVENKVDIELLSNSTGDFINIDAMKNPLYWANHMRNSVQWVQQINAIHKNSADIK